MKKSFLSIAILLTLLSCSNHPGQVRIQGSFAHLEQGEFFLYSTDGSSEEADTLRLREGKFRKDIPLEHPTTLYILYPNMSRLALFAAPGEDIRLKGDAQHLNGVSVSGNKDNEIYTRFREDITGKNDKETTDIALRYIREHTDKNVAVHLFRQYFLNREKADRHTIRGLYDTLRIAQEENAELIKLADRVRNYRMLGTGEKLPDFELRCRSLNNDTTRTLIAHKAKAGEREKPLLMLFWAGWKSGSQGAALYHVRRFLKTSDQVLDVISYSLDFETKTLERVERRDSLADYHIHSYCDFQAWDSPLIREWGIQDIPFFILTDKKGTIVASGNDWREDIEPKIKNL